MPEFLLSATDVFVRTYFVFRLKTHKNLVARTTIFCLMDLCVSKSIHRVPRALRFRLGSHLNNKRHVLPTVVPIDGNQGNALL
jgi:hypothetical protein